MDERLISAAEATLRHAGALHDTATVLVALSGGADSVALLLSVLELHKTHGIAVRAAHVEHGLRGEQALADAAFCQALCKRLHVPYHCDHARLSGDMHDTGAETRAREVRYALLLAHAKACKADALLLAHHQDDQAETVLQHLLRGSGTRGLRGMEAISVRDGVVLCRPFLSLSKQTLLDALGGEPYRTDESNASPVCQRNRIRLEIMPRLMQENPAAMKHIAQTAELLGLDEACLQKQADRVLQQTLIDKPPYFCLHKEVLRAADEAIALRVLRRFAELGLTVIHAESSEQSLSVADSLALLALVTAPENTAINLPGALHALATGHFIHLTRMQNGEPLHDVPLPPSQPLDTRRKTIPFGTVALHVQPWAIGDPCPDGIRGVVLPRSLAKTAVLRQPQAGDTIRPFGASGTKPLRRYLIDRKLDQPFRKHLPIVASGSTVLWAAGIGAAESTRTTAEPSLLFTLQGTVPWQSIYSKRSKP